MEYRWMMVVLAALGLVSPGMAADKRPNLLVFLVDDMGLADTSVQFLYDAVDRPVAVPLNQRYRTPNMERLARSGLRFTNAQAYPVCTPTRAAMLTGLDAARLQITTWTNPKRAARSDDANKGGLRSPDWALGGVNPQLPTLPRILRDSGYHTIHCGKAHFGPDSTAAGNPLNLGFEVNIAGYGGGGPGSYHGEKNYSAAWRKGGHDWDVPGLEKYHGSGTYLTEALTLELGAELERSVKSGKPFYAYMAHYAVHAPFETDPRFAANYPGMQGAALAFATMVEGMDKSLGDLLAKLEALGVAEETLVVFYSDNGSAGPANLPLRGMKGTRYDGGTRVPMIVSWAKRNPANPLQQALPVPAGAREDDIVQPADMLPTLAAIAGAPVPEKLDGCDLGAYIKGLPGTHRPQTWLVHFPHQRTEDALFSSFREGDWKVIYDYLHKQWELYNLAYDPSEKTNLVDTKPEVALGMAERLVAALKERGAQPPIDTATGNGVDPDLSALRAAAETARKAMPPPPFAKDDLNLGAMVRPVAEENCYRDAGYYTWCNSIVKGEGGRYHLFYVRWRKEAGFDGWLTESETCRAVATSPAGPYAFERVVLPRRGAHAWNQYSAHNASVRQFGSKYYLYFIGTNDGGRGLDDAKLLDVARAGAGHPLWRPLRNNQRVGVAVADAIDGPWTVLDRPVAEPGGPISQVTVNPAVWQAADRKYMMILKGNSMPANVAQAVAVADAPTGPFHIQPELAFDRYSEDVAVWTDRARELTYGILHDGKGFGLIASEDGIHWRDGRNFRVIGKTVPLAGGGQLQPTRYERPFLYAEDGVPKVLGGAAQIDGGKDAYIVLLPLADPHASGATR